MDDSEIRRSIGERIKLARNAQSWLQSELAAEIGVTKGHMSQAEAGLGTLSLPVFARLCWVLPADPRYLLTFPEADAANLQDRLYQLAGLFSSADADWLLSLTAKQRKAAITAVRREISDNEEGAREATS